MSIFHLMRGGVSFCRIAKFVFLSCLLLGCHAKRIVTVAEVRSILEKNVRVGSSGNEVISFVESLKIDSLRVAHSPDLESVELLRYDNFDEEKMNDLQGKVKEFYDASIMDTAPSTETLMVYVRIRFYFGSERDLLDYTIKEETSFR